MKKPHKSRLSIAWRGAVGYNESGPETVLTHRPGPNQGTPYVEGFDVAQGKLPSPDLLRQLVDYDPNTGRMVWRHRSPDVLSPFGGTARAAAVWNARYARTYADANVNTNGYREVCVHNFRMRAHRVAWAIFYGFWPENEVDHIDHDRLNNRIANLRSATRKENARNQSLRTDNKSGIVGIWDKKPKAWGARWVVVVAEGSRIIQKRSFHCLGEAILFRNDSYRARGFSPQHGTPALCATVNEPRPHGGAA